MMIEDGGVTQKHAPLKRFAVRNATTPWLDKEIKDAMKLRDQLKKNATITGDKYDVDLYKRKRNIVTKLNRKKRKLYFYESEKNT